METVDQLKVSEKFRVKSIVVKVLREVLGTPLSLTGRKHK